MAHRRNWGDVIATLNRLVADGVIASFRTDLFDRDEAGSAPSVAVMVHDAHSPEPALQQVRDALEPLGIDLTVRLSRWQQARGETARSGKLTPRQQEVLELMVQGKSNEEIAEALGLSKNTVKVHVVAIFRALGVSNRVEATLVGLRHLKG